MGVYDNWIDGSFVAPPNGRRMATRDPFVIG